MYFDNFISFVQQIFMRQKYFLQSVSSKTKALGRGVLKEKMYFQNRMGAILLSN